VFKAFTKGLYVTLFGVFFALLQTSYFFQLEIWLTAAYPAFLTITLGWLMGNIVGLRFDTTPWGKAIPLAVWLLISLGAYYLVIVLLQLFPDQRLLLPLYGVCIGLAGMLAGRFFVISRTLFSSSAKLFFMENNGFVLGWVLGFFGFVWRGHIFNLTAPFIFGGLNLLLLRLVSVETVEKS